MLRRLRVQNFKGWNDTGPIRLAPLTVLFGSNSSGKSSLLQFLLLLRQTAESPDRRRVLHPGDRTTPVELGTYRDLVFNHDPARKLEFEISWDLPKKLEIKDPKSNESSSGSSLTFSATITSDAASGQQYVEGLKYTLNEQTHVTVTLTELRNKAKREYKLAADGYKLVYNQGRKWPLPPPIRFYGFPDEANAYYQNASFTSDLAFAFESQLKRIQYLGPLRDKPARSYIWSGEVPEHVGWGGDRAVEAMLAARDRCVSVGPKKRKKPFAVVMAEWLKRLGLLESFEVKQLGSNRKDYEVLVKTPGSKDTVNLPDVGFGVSQVLPVLVETFYAAPNSTILLEQPEIHLHPKVQSELADLFIEVIHSREDGQDRSTQLIVESHSEHFLRRLQTRIAERSVEPADVALYFCSPGSAGARIEELKLNMFGDIANWPEDFFGDELGELAARMDAAAKKDSQGHD